MVKAPSVEKFADAVWAESRWRRGSPPKRTIRAHRQHLKCAAGDGHRKAIKAHWRKAQRSYLKRRWHVTRDWCSPHPSPEGEGCWEIPAWCVGNESGGSWSADNPTSDARGPYQLLGHGEPWPVTNWHEALEHHEIAAGLYASGGLSPWVAC